MFGKVLFLDIDGVLNLEDGNRDSNHIDKDMVAHLNWIIKSTGVKVVISSTWRSSMSAAQIHDHLSKFGFDGDIIGCTADNGKARFAQISDWLDDHGAHDFIILDDMSVMDHLLHLPAFAKIAKIHFFQTDKSVGLTSDIADKIIDRLNNHPA